MTDEELSISDVTLIARLRAVCTCNIDSTPCMAEDDCRDALAAAARIETLVKEKEQLGREVNMARYGQPDFAWSIHEDAMADLEAKLAKAEAGLLAIAKRDEQMIWGEDYEVEEAFKDMRDIALATLAEIKGESHDPL